MNLARLGPIGRVVAYIAAIGAVGAGAHAAWPAKKHVTVVAVASPAAHAGLEENPIQPGEFKPVGPLEVGSMLPPNDHDDAPGGDSRNLPRPDNARRIFVSPLDAQGSSIRVYRRTGTVADLEKELGPKTVAMGYTQYPSGETGTLNFKRGNDLAIIRIIPAEEGGKSADSVASLIEMPFRTPDGARGEAR